MVRIDRAPVPQCPCPAPVYLEALYRALVYARAAQDNEAYNSVVSAIRVFLNAWNAGEIGWHPWENTWFLAPLSESSPGT